MFVGDRFAEYLAKFRERYPLDPELAEKHGVPTGNGCFRSHMNHTASGSYGGSA